MEQGFVNIGVHNSSGYFFYKNTRLFNTEHCERYIYDIGSHRDLGSRVKFNICLYIKISLGFVVWLHCYEMDYGMVMYMVYM